MRSFDDPGVQAERERFGANHVREGATIEIARTGTRSGIAVQVDGVSSYPQLRMLLALAVEVAGRESRPAVHEPGWWALIVGMAAIDMGPPARVQRSLDPGARHAVVRVESQRLVDGWPDWPMIRLHSDAPWLDLRGESALAHGPGLLDLDEFACRSESHVTIAEVARAFELGALEWEPGEPRAGERRRLRRAT